MIVAGCRAHSFENTDEILKHVMIARYPDLLIIEADDSQSVNGVSQGMTSILEACEIKVPILVATKGMEISQVVELAKAFRQRKLKRFSEIGNEDDVALAIERSIISDLQIQENTDKGAVLELINIENLSCLRNVWIGKEGNDIHIEMHEYPAVHGKGETKELALTDL